MRSLLLASIAALALAYGPALADSLLSGSGAKLGGDAGARAGVTGDVGGTSVGVGTEAQADTHAAVDTGTAGGASEPSAAAADTAPSAGTATTGDVQNGVQGSAQSVLAASQLIGKTVLDANGQEVGEVSNAVLTIDAHAVSKIVVASGGFLGIGTREVAVDAESVDTSAASEGSVRLRNLTGADLDAMAVFQVDGSVRLLNPS